MKNPSYVGFLAILVIVGGVFLSPKKAEAETSLFDNRYQLSTYSTAGTSAEILWRGGAWLDNRNITNDLQGIVISVNAKDSGLGTDRRAYLIIQCYSDDFTTSAPCDGTSYPVGSTNHLATTSPQNLQNTTALLRYTNFTTSSGQNTGYKPFVLTASSTMTYVIKLQDGSPEVQMKGTSIGSTTFSYSPTTGLTDGDLVISYGENTGTYPNINIVSPIMGTSTSSDDVEFNFDWSAGTAYSITNYAIRIQDVSAKNSDPFILSGELSGTSGTVLTTQTLTDGHIYTWTPTICNDNGTCYDQQTVSFGVGAASFNALQQYFYVGDGTLNTATSSTDFYGIIPLVSSVINKVPFGYLVQIANAFQDGIDRDNAETNTTIFEMNLHDVGMGSTSPIGNFLPNITLDSDTIKNTMGDTAYTALFTILKLSIYASGLFYLWNRGRSVVAKMR